MNYIFKVLNSTPPAVPTVGDTNFVQHYSGVNTNLSWAELLPVIRQAADEWLVPFVGEQLYDDIAAKFTTGASLTPEQARALLLMQDALAGYAIYKIMPQKVNAIASLGIVENTPEAAQPTGQWKYAEKRLDALASADSALDRLLGYLNAQVLAEVAYFDLYKNSTAYTKKNSVFFKTADNLGDYINLQNSRRTFVSLIPHMRRVEDSYIKAALCDVTYNNLQTASPSAANAKLLPFVREAVAYLGAVEALPHHRVVVDGDGFRVVSHTDGFTDRRNLTNSVHEQAVGALLETYKSRGNAALQSLIAFLEANLADYPDYAASDCRKKPSSRAHGMVASPDKIGAVGIF